MTKRSSFSHKTRHSLSDITNSRPQQQQQEELILQETGLEQSEKVNRLMKENLALVKLLEERDETIEHNKYEMRNLREGMHRLQVQNLSLAQTNSQFFAEINLARNKMKALHHEVTCKNALLKTKCYEPQKEENTQPRNLVTTENNNKLETTDEESEKPYVPNRRKFIRSKSFRAFTEYETDVEKEKSQTKRRQSRRKSARLRSSSQETKENNLFEIKDLQLTIPSEMSQQEEENLPRRKSSLIALRHDDDDDDDDDCKVSKSPFNRTLRKAVKKIHSYKGVY
ncbi:unnamed protein product [Cochlearia groenlandica]